MCLLKNNSTTQKVLFVLLLVAVTICNGIAEKNSYSTSFCPKVCTCSLLQEETICKNANLSELPNNISLEVKILNLADNKINIFPQELSKFKQLQTLILNHNRIKKLVNTNLNISSLQFVFLQNNLITWNQIQPDFINLMTSLIELDLSHNNLGKLDSTILKSNSLQSLALINCSIQMIPHSFLFGLTNLKVLKLSDNRHLKAVDFTSKFLNELYVVDCNLEYINLANFPSLKLAILRGNRIDILIEQDLINNNLEVLDLSDNGIKFIKPDAFIHLPKLKTLNISVNVFIDLHPTTFIMNKNLNTLIISRTYLKTLVPFIIPSLIILDLSVNEIQDFNEKSLISMQSLQKLILSRNLIYRLPNQIKSTSLRYLDLSMCQIADIRPLTFVNLLNLQKLDLSGNRLTYLNVNYLPKNLKNINLAKNLWRCECYSKNFKEQHDFLVPNLLHSESLLCHSPENVSMMTWNEACRYSWNLIATGNMRRDRMWLYVLSLIISMSVVFAVIICIRRMRKIKLMREQEERRRQFLEAQERINRLRREQQREIEAQQNAPDPRDLVLPPSYLEAISMPRLNNSFSNLVENDRRSSSRSSRRSLRQSRTVSSPDLSKSRHRDNQNESTSKSSNSQTRRKTKTRNENRRRIRRSRTENFVKATQSVPNLEVSDDECLRNLTADESVTVQRDSNHY